MGCITIWSSVAAAPAQVSRALARQFADAACCIFICGRLVQKKKTEGHLSQQKQTPESGPRLACASCPPVPPAYTPTLVPMYSCIHHIARTCDKDAGRVHQVGGGGGQLV